jgi:hypothetical protein
MCLISHSPPLLVRFMQHTHAGPGQLYDNLKVSVHSLWDRQLHLIKSSLRFTFLINIFVAYSGQVNVTLTLTSDLFDVLFPVLCGTNLTFWKKLWLFRRSFSWLWGAKLPKLAESSEMTVQRNSLKGHDLWAVNAPQILRATSGIQPPETV